VLLKPKRGKYTMFSTDTALTKDNIKTWIDDVLSGNGSFKKVDGVKLNFNLNEEL
jgi:hypothetical protein